MDGECEGFIAHDCFEASQLMLEEGASGIG